MGVGYILTHTLVKGHADSINCLSFSLCGSYLASGADDYRLLIWRVQDGSLLYEIMFESAVNAVIWDPCSGDTIICGCNDGLLYRAKNFCLVMSQLFIVFVADESHNRRMASRAKQSTLV
jgi:WD40 repeat protein